MKYLRHPQLATWLVLLALCAGVLIAAGVRGDDAIRNGTAARVLGPTPASASAVRGHVDQLRALTHAGLAAGVDPHALTGWARQVQQVAGDAVDVRTGERAGNDDPLHAGLTRVAADAGVVVENATDPVAGPAARTRVLLAIDHVTATVQGLPAPTLPDPATDPLQLRQRPTLPDAPTPPAPTPPTLPTSRP